MHIARGIFIQWQLKSEHIGSVGNISIATELALILAFTYSKLFALNASIQGIFKLGI